MESLFNKLSRNQKRIWRFVIIAFCVLVMAYVLIPIIGIRIYGLPDIGDDDPQAVYQPDQPFEKVFHALWTVALFPSWTLEFFRMKAGINPPGIIGNSLLFILPGLFWAFFVELLFEARKWLRSKIVKDVKKKNS